MNLNFILSSFLFLILIIVVIDLPLSLCQDDPSYTNCSRSFQCGNIQPFINYPFWGNGRAEYCGRSGFELKCQDSITQIEIMNETYRVLTINPSDEIMTIARLDLWDDVCPSRFENATLNFNQFQYSPGVVNLTLLYGCPPPPLPSMPTSPFKCPISGNNNDSVYIDPSGFINFPPGMQNQTCTIRIEVPVLQTAAQRLSGGAVYNLPQVLKDGFDVRYDGGDAIPCKQCTDSGGHCGFYSASNRFTCFCRNGPNQESCSDSNSTAGGGGGGYHLGLRIGIGGNNKGVQIGAGVGAGIGALLMIVVIFVLYRRRRKQSLPTSTLVSKNISPDPSLKRDLEKGSTYFQTPIFTYTELEEATNNFDSSKELGDGGFGTVYYGKLRDGRVVAVKRLYENNFKRVEQFMNEIAILSRIRHQNLVSLYGCTSRHCRELLLVYEFIPNGTIADHLHGQRNKPGFLTWPIRMNIAIESADALAYLHASDIIHRDVKTNNILLDNSFHVKVADFGLSRLFPTDKTHVSTAPQGTPGYVDPEYYQCYQLTDRSDVYSFGVVLIELISSKPAVDVNRHRHDINLANMAITKIQNHALHELVDPHLGFESDYAIRMMITLVAELAFRCLQQKKEMRPSMMEVLEALRGIQSEEYKTEKADEVDIPSDDVVLLKNMPPPSPDSVTEQWTSSISTTPNISC